MIRAYARERAAELIDRLEGEVQGAGRMDDAAAVHDLRVAIRRLGRCLRVFAQFYPKGPRRRARRRLSRLMDAAAAVRDRDIALELMDRAGIAPRTSAVRTLRRAREAAARELDAHLGKWRKRGLPGCWREEMEL